MAIATRARTKRREEDTIQAAIVGHIRTVLPNAIVLHLNNTPRNAIDGARLKRMGLLKGAPDLLVAMDGGRGLFIEVKAPKGAVAKSQMEFANACVAINWPRFVARSIDDVRLAFKALGIKTREAGI